MKDRERFIFYKYKNIRTTHIFKRSFKDYEFRFNEDMKRMKMKV
jgi:hypothetical protein